MNKMVKLVFFGFLTWLVPFLVSFFFYDRSGVISVNPIHFKAVMIVVGTGIGLHLLTQYFKDIDKNYLFEGAKIGIIWFAINIFLDLLFLVPMAKMSYPDYFSQIGLEYVSIIFYGLAMGLVLERHTKEIVVRKYHNKVR